MHRVLAFSLSIWLCGCGLAPAIMKSDSMSYGDVIEDSTNKLLVTNVLRARDKAPLHFADVPVIRQSMQQTVSANWLHPFDARNGSSQRDILTLGGSLQFSPSFELTHLQSKEFITGISSPIDPKVVKYWLDRGLDRRIVLLLFFSAAEIVETRQDSNRVRVIKIMNSPRDAIDVIKARKRPFTGPEALKCDTQSDFERYLKLLNAVRTFFANIYRERRILARNMKLDPKEDSRALARLAALDQSKIRLTFDKVSAEYSLYALSSEEKVAFCFFDERRPGRRLTPNYEVIQAGQDLSADRRTCYRRVVEASAEDSPSGRPSERPVFFRGPAELNQPTRYCRMYNQFIGVSPSDKSDELPSLQVRLRIRSVGEIFQFLGDLLEYQDEIKRYLESDPKGAVKLNTPITFGYCPDDPGPGCDDIFFRLDGDPASARFTLTYRATEYAVANINSGPQRKDHTLEILSVLHQLVNLNKSASDIRATPSVQVLP